MVGDIYAACCHRYLLLHILYSFYFVLFLSDSLSVFLLHILYSFYFVLFLSDSLSVFL